MLTADNSQAPLLPALRQGTDLRAKSADVSMHSAHPYPAKFPARLARKLLLRHVRPGDVVLDPFCGSGTTLLEAKLHGAHSIGVDINALSCLISMVKTTPLADLDRADIRRFLRAVQREGAPNYRSTPFCALPGIDIDHWFQKNVSAEIAAIVSRIERDAQGAARDFLKVALSAIIVRVSNQESDTRYAAIQKNIGDGQTTALFLRKARENLDYASRSFAKEGGARVAVHNADSRDLSFLAEGRVDCVITSPPYANSYDYYLYHKFRCAWLGLDFKFAQNGEIGSRREYSSMKQKPGKWEDDLCACLLQLRRVLKPRGDAFFVFGDSVIAGEKIEGDKLMSAAAARAGFGMRDVSSAPLSGHSRAFNPAFAREGKKEHIIHLRKNE